MEAERQRLGERLAAVEEEVRRAWCTLLPVILAPCDRAALYANPAPLFFLALLVLYPPF